ncbi:MAG: FAD synthetase family protein [Chloroflexi bacterium]|nr:MAG: FAD synthetase family protein [Chloroflexota bacterium]
MTALTFGFPQVGSLGLAHATIGTFDGLHRGHQALLRPLIAGARRAEAQSVLVTFDPHPRCVLDPEHCPACLTTVDEKRWLLEQMGLDQLIVIPFTAQVAGLTPGAFMKRLMRGMELRHLVTGADFRFGQLNRRARREAWTAAWVSDREPSHSSQQAGAGERRLRGASRDRWSAAPRRVECRIPSNVRRPQPHRRGLHPRLRGQSI